MLTARSSDYKGCRITTWWAESCSLDLCRGKHFEAAYSVRPIDPDEEAWQRFPKAVFDTHEGAEANALDAAQRSIDDLASERAEHRKHDTETRAKANLREGREARAAGLSVFRNPSFKGEELPNSRSLREEWQAKAAAWLAGWEVENARRCHLGEL